MTFIVKGQIFWRAVYAARQVLLGLLVVFVLSASGCSQARYIALPEQRDPVTPKARALAEAEANAASSISAPGTASGTTPKTSSGTTSTTASATASGSPAMYADLEGWSLEEKQAATFIHTAPVFFYYDSFALTDQAKQVLRQKAEKIKAFSQFRIIIAGHCDERGTDAYNYALGGKRAKAALDYLVSIGVNSAQLGSISYGKSNPKASSKDEAGMSQNRRDDFHVSKKE
jgi:peptidoglycan-associated lipoprotein